MLSLSALLSLSGCLNDFGIQAMPDTKPGGLDSAADTGPADTGPATDSPDPRDTDTGTAAADDSADDTEPPDSDPPVDSEPVVEDPPPADDRDETSDLIYVLSRDDDLLYTFDPASLRFTSLGEVDCNTSLYPASMAVSRAGIAYVRYENDEVYSLDLATMTCSPTGYSDRRTGFDSFGMGYATDDPTTWRDQLYVANSSTVGVLDTNTWNIQTLGAMPSQSELTGNAAGELWAMLPLERPAQLRRIDTASGANLETLRLSAFPDPSTIDTFAFATWDGEFYLFVRISGMGNTTDVYRVERDGTMSTLLRDVGFNVVGAGVSTCAP